MLRTITLLALLLTTALPAVAAERAEFGSSSFNFTAVDCVVTDVRLAEDSLTVDFQGRWRPVCEYRQERAVYHAAWGGSNEGWNALVTRAKAALNKRAAIKIRSSGYMMMGGIPFFHVPQATVKILILESR